MDMSLLRKRSMNSASFEKRIYYSFYLTSLLAPPIFSAKSFFNCYSAVSFSRCCFKPTLRVSLSRYSLYLWIYCRSYSLRETPSAGFTSR